MDLFVTCQGLAHAHAGMRIHAISTGSRVSWRCWAMARRRTIITATAMQIRSVRARYAPPSCYRAPETHACAGHGPTHQRGDQVAPHVCQGRVSRRKSPLHVSAHALTDARALGQGALQGLYVCLFAWRTGAHAHTRVLRGRLDRLFPRPRDQFARGAVFGRVRVDRPSV